MELKVNIDSFSGRSIFVGLSGGVDSAVTAALLKEAGAKVTGVFIQGWYPPGQPCSWRDDRRDAMRVAAHLGIPFRTLDASAEYKEQVIDYLLSEYRAGRTPNPDIMCNREVKFGAFYRYAKAEGADLIATGHYAQAIHADGYGTLIRGVDASKDQSYFLWAVPKEILSDTIFPLGGMEKKRVRELSHEFGLPVSDKKDSQGICFLGSISVEEFLKQEIGTEPGEVRTADGEAVGRHDGAILYTIGERIALKPSEGQSAKPGPWYVTAKDLRTNVLTVAHSPSHPEQQEDILLLQTNMLEEVSESETIEAQYRYHGPSISGTFDASRNAFQTTDPLPETLAPGQSLVLYRGEQCVGGGIIG